MLANTSPRRRGRRRIRRRSSLYCRRAASNTSTFFESCGVEFKDTFYDEKVIFPPTDDCLIYSGNELAWPFRENATPVPRGHKPKREGSAGAYLIEQMISTLEKPRAERSRTTQRRRDAGPGRGPACRRASSRRIDGDGTRDPRARRRRPHDGRLHHEPRDAGALRSGAGAMQHADREPDGCDGSGIRMGLGAGGNAINMSEGLDDDALLSAERATMKGMIVNRPGSALHQRGRLSRSRDRLDHEEGRRARVPDRRRFDLRRGAAVRALQAGRGMERDDRGARKRTLEMPKAALADTLNALQPRPQRSGEDPAWIHKASEVAHAAGRTRPTPRSISRSTRVTSGPCSRSADSRRRRAAKS